MIRGFFESRYQSLAAKVLVGLVLPHRGPEFVPIEFVIDTGADASALHPGDTIRRFKFSGDDFAAARRVASDQRSLTGIGGVAVYDILPARYIFAQTDGTPLAIETEIGIAEPTSQNANLPSVLGWDLLSRFRITLDRRLGEVTLE